MNTGWALDAWCKLNTWLQISLTVLQNPGYEGIVFNGMERACECDNFRCGLAANNLSCSGESVTMREKFQWCGFD